MRFLMILPLAGGGPNSAPLLALAGILLVFTIAELLLSPVGLSLSTKLAPAAFHTQMVALFFLSVALGTALSGTLAGYYSPEHETVYFGVLGAVAVVLGLDLAAAARPITLRKGMLTTVSPARAMTTVAPAKTTAEPAVPTARPAASSASIPSVRYCRCREVMNRE